MPVVAAVRNGESGRVEFDAYARGERDPVRVASEPVREVHHGVGFGLGCPRADLKTGFEAQVPAGFEAASDLSRDIEQVAGLGARSEDGHGALGHGTAHCDRESERVVVAAVAGDVATDERTGPVVGPAAHCVEEGVGGGIALGQHARRECPVGVAAHRGDVADAAGDGLAGDEVQVGARLEVTPFDELIDGEKLDVTRRSLDDGTVVAGADEEFASAEPQGVGAGVDVAVKGGFVHTTS